MKEVRYNTFENVSQEEMVLEGYAAVFNQPTVLYSEGDVEFKEQIDPGAFANAITKDCYLKYNHMDSILPLARTRGGSLQIKVDDFGLFFRAQLFDTSVARDLYALVKQGGLDRCSFAFNIAPGGAVYDRNTRTSTITKISHLWDCAIVAVPAYDQTTVSARAFFVAQEEAATRADAEVAEAARQLEIRRKKLILLSRL